MLDLLIPLAFGVGLTLLCLYWDRTDQAYQERKRAKKRDKQ